MIRIKIEIFYHFLLFTNKFWAHWFKGFNAFSYLGSVDFEEFLLLMSKKMSMLDIDQELLEAFSVFDKDGKYILHSTISLFRHV